MGGILSGSVLVGEAAGCISWQETERIFDAVFAADVVVGVGAIATGITCIVTHNKQKSADESAE